MNVGGLMCVIFAYYIAICVWAVFAFRGADDETNHHNL